MLEKPILNNHFHNVIIKTEPYVGILYYAIMTLSLRFNAIMKIKTQKSFKVVIGPWKK